VDFLIYPNGVEPREDIQISFGHEQPFEVERTGPDDEALKAFC
jgi:hypothetical protein